MFGRVIIGIRKEMLTGFQLQNIKTNKKEFYNKFDFASKESYRGSMFSLANLNPVCFYSNSAVFSETAKKEFIKSIEAIKRKPKESKLKDAAVLVPLCLVQNEPAVLLTVRSSKLGRNKSDISFPGGVSDYSDKNVIDSALRETEEEIGIIVKESQVWTTMPPLDRNDMRVTPVVAYIGNIENLNFVINTDEVDHVFPLFLMSLCDAKNQFYTEFKPGYSLPVFKILNYRIWGLTSGVLHYLMMLLMPNIYKNALPISYKPSRRRK